ncbi:MAG TPA: tRNA uridine(34) 5-carboxymethylaminomethyl modification radical SAM/GNAT enzyme Elp3 [Anaerolineales bacterium]|nr:tRNA uridine(34) 5-carboxymethylaminomethyl modification radical SAM/GNAT enzyme Elp3 [Anaerolineales bacterium]
MSFEETFKERRRAWHRNKRFTQEKMAAARQALADVRNGIPVFDAIKRHPLPGEGGGYVGKQFLVAAYREMVALGEMEPDRALLEKIRMKPMRTLSGVTTVTVLTKPYPCPGKCIFCPTDYRMPKSYLPDEPGAMRALQHDFDPYEQVKDRIQALHAIGHPTDKIELLILGGTWSSYRKDYQEWFVLRCFQAMNGMQAEVPEPAEPGPQHTFSAALIAAQQINETAGHRCVGLVIETRPDHVDPAELAWLRHLGVTKVQMGAQSFDDRILALNKRGHTIAETRTATDLLRAAGFKIVLHWMPNLFGATPESDREDFKALWTGFCPDEIKIYPNQLLANAELYEFWQRGEYTPYTTEDLVDLIADIKPSIPRYCRVNRVIRDIPSTNVVAGNRRTSLRMDVQTELRRRGTVCECIRCREVRKQDIEVDELRIEEIRYPAGDAEERFISFVTQDDRLAGFVRLSLPQRSDPGVLTVFDDLQDAALIRELHVYGQSLPVGQEKGGAAQHRGLGTRLLELSEAIAVRHGFHRLAVISAVGTRRYYEERGYRRGRYYQVKDLS